MAASKFINSGKDNPCPLCDRTHDRDCSWSEDLNLILCHGLVAECPREIRGYRFVKIAKGGYHDESAEYLRIREVSNWQKPARPSGQKIYYYPTLDGTKLARTTRIDTNGKKKFFQESWNGEEWVQGLTEEVKTQIHLYRITDPINQKALKQGLPLLIVEGEGKVDQLIAMGKAASCCIAGGGKWNAYGGAIGNYKSDLAGVCQNKLILCPDRDQPGVKHCETINADFPDAVWFYVDSGSTQWDQLPAKDGYDIGDWILDQKKSGQSEDEIINQIVGGAGKKRELKQLEAIEAEPQQLDQNPDDLNPADEVIDCSIENHIYKRLFDSGSGAYCVIDDNFCQYSGQGYWQVLEERKVKQAIARLANKAYKLRYTKEANYPIFCYGKDASVVSTYRFCRDLLSIEPVENRHLRCFKNCTVDLKTGKKLQHSKDHYLTTSIAAEYEAGAECPEIFKQFISNAYGNDLLPVVQACTSMLLDSTAPYGHIIHLVGPSGSGKGTLLRFWGSMFGLGQTRSGSSLSELATAEGRHQLLSGTAVYFCPDIGGHQQELRAAYELADNGPMSGRALYSSNTYQKVYDTRLVVASVDYLSIENSGDGWNRRVIPLPSKPRKGIPDQDLEIKLQTVKAQVISWCLSMKQVDRNYVLNHLEEFSSIAQSKRDGAIAADPVRLFVDMCLAPGEESKPEECLDSKKLHSYYLSFCHAFGYYPMQLQRFVGQLKGVLPEFYVPRQRSRDNWKTMIPSFWRNIEIIPSVFEDNPESSYPKCIKRFCRESQLDSFADFLLNNDHHDRQRSSTQEGVNDRGETPSEQALEESRSPRSSTIARVHKKNNSDDSKKEEDKKTLIEVEIPGDRCDRDDRYLKNGSTKGFDNDHQLSHNWHTFNDRGDRSEMDPSSPDFYELEDI